MIRRLTVMDVVDRLGASLAGIKVGDILDTYNDIELTSDAVLTNAANSATGDEIRIRVFTPDGVRDLRLARSRLGIGVFPIDFDEHAYFKELEERRRCRELPLTTAQIFADKRIVKTVDIVGAQCIYGVNAFADLAAGIREFVGGRSQGLQKKVAEARLEVCRELREEAYKLGANGVVAVTLEHTEIGDKGGYMLMVTGTGTAVIVE